MQKCNIRMASTAGRTVAERLWFTERGREVYT
jgi:hypothetical protein